MMTTTTRMTWQAVVFVAAMSSWYGRNYFHQGVEDVAGAWMREKARLNALLRRRAELLGTPLA